MLFYGFFLQKSIAKLHSIGGNSRQMFNIFWPETSPERKSIALMRKKLLQP
jgi:hypothetical protein